MWLYDFSINKFFRPYSGAMDGPSAKQSSHGYYAGGPSAPAPVPVAMATPGVIDPEISRPVYGLVQKYFVARNFSKFSTISLNAIETSRADKILFRYMG